ncbi:MAG: MgtC/SapB family protein [Candidatus Korobacteraceae bacterium]
MIPISHIVLRVCLATVFGGVVGMEREHSERAAGLRTHAMVGLGSSVFMLVSAFGFKDILGAPDVVLDPSRIAAQIVTGIGFLGAGTIIFQREMVRGLTTAASIWVVAAIGVAVGGGMYVLASTTTALALMVLVVLKKVEKRWFRARHSRSLSLLFDPNTTSVSELQSAVEERGHHLEQIVILPGEVGNTDRANITLNPATEKDIGLLMDRLRHISGVRQISVNN